MQYPNEPMWFNNETKEAGTETNVTNINLGRSPHKIMVCTPVHSDVSMHYCQAVLKCSKNV